MIMTRSTASTPICSPQLPPEMVMNAGALQPFAVRQVATPLPPLPPKMNPPLTMCGTTATHLACSNTSSGIPLSGIPIISCNTVVALPNRSVASSRPDPAQHSVPRLNIASNNITFFIGQASFLLALRRLFAHAVCTLAQRNPVDMAAQLVTSKFSDSGFRGLSNSAQSGCTSLQLLPGRDEGEFYGKNGQICSDLGSPRNYKR